MTLPSELLGLIEALELEALRAAEGILHGDLGEARRLNAARIALEAGIERYREEGQEAAAKVADAEAVKFDRLVVQCNMLEAAWYDWQNRAGVARTIAAAIRALRPTPGGPKEESK